MEQPFLTLSGIVAVLIGVTILSIGSFSLIAAISTVIFAKSRKEIKIEEGKTLPQNLKNIQKFQHHTRFARLGRNLISRYPAVVGFLFAMIMISFIIVFTKFYLTWQYNENFLHHVLQDVHVQRLTWIEQLAYYLQQHINLGFAGMGCVIIYVVVIFSCTCLGLFCCIKVHKDLSGQ
ncbi:MAG: hypothetical protein KDC18_16990 [Alphaproteobacteria bacterium]|nr:hypothetical protein [Alphaproteobacteria bacterium]MCB9929067.1 hypothetical protein [Alphaproteobacteria bacterium]